MSFVFFFLTWGNDEGEKKVLERMGDLSGCRFGLDWKWELG